MDVSDGALAAAGYLSDIRVWTGEMKLAARRWLKNFSDDEQELAASLLDSFVFFSDDLVDRLFVAAFDSLAIELGDPTTSYDELKARWEDFVDRVLITHPTGEMPNVTDSGYAFDRRARQLLGIGQGHILEPEAVLANLLVSPQPVVFVDDFVGSGDQFRKTWHREYEIGGQRVSFASVVARGGYDRLFYCPLVCTRLGYNVIEAQCPGLKVRPTHLIPEESSGNHVASLLWPEALRPEATNFVEATSSRAGIPHARQWGYANLALALAFEHGVPDATLPILYWEEGGWVPLVRLR